MSRVATTHSLDVTGGGRVDRRLRLLAWAHFAGAAGIVLFWTGFYSGVLFSPVALEGRIPNFQGYLAWERAFTLPDLLMAAAMVWGGALVLRDGASRLGTTVLGAASGGLLFLSVLDVGYGLSQGMYALGHVYSLALLSVPVLGLLGLVTLVVLHRARSSR